jgi:hypothetical protein
MGDERVGMSMAEAVLGLKPRDEVYVLGQGRGADEVPLSAGLLAGSVTSSNRRRRRDHLPRLRLVETVWKAQAPGASGSAHRAGGLSDYQPAGAPYDARGLVAVEGGEQV